jgi:hypothetical protein
MFNHAALVVLFYTPARASAAARPGSSVGRTGMVVLGVNFDVARSAIERGPTSVIDKLKAYIEGANDWLAVVVVHVLTETSYATLATPRTP